MTRYRPVCFSCAKPKPLVRNHIVCDDCHGNHGPCKRVIKGKTCGYTKQSAERKKLAA